MPIGGVAVRVTAAPALYFAEYVLPQLMPARSLVTVPTLLRPIESVNWVVPPPPAGGLAVNSALTLIPSLMVAAHVRPAPVHPPVQPVNVVLLPAFAVRVTIVPRLGDDHIA